MSARPPHPPRGPSLPSIPWSLPSIRSPRNKSFQNGNFPAPWSPESTAGINCLISKGLPGRSCRRHIKDYSVLKLFTGLASAACTHLTLTVAMAISPIPGHRKGNGGGHQHHKILRQQRHNMRRPGKAVKQPSDVRITLV